MSEIPRTAVAGDGQEVRVEPSVHKVFLELEQPTESDPRSDLDRLRDGLRAAGLSAAVDRTLLSDLPSTLRRSKGAIRRMMPWLSPSTWERRRLSDR